MKKIVVFITFILALLMCMASCSIVLPSGSTSESEPEHTHDFGEWFISESATCTKDGLTVCYCSCGEKLSETIKRFPHTVVIDKGAEPTCTETGLTEGKHCYVCNTVLVAQTTVPANGHNYGEWSVITQPTESTTGEKRRDCANCDAFETDVVGSPSHDHSRWDTITLSAVAPTCITTGLTEGKKCSGCNEILVVQNTISALGHTEVKDNVVAPTCTTTGLTEGKHCSACNEVLIAQTTVEALGHTEANAVIENKVTPTCTTTGLCDSVVYCSVCGDELSREAMIASMVAHNYVDDYCTVCGDKEELYTRDGDYIYFGEYPQTIKTNDVTITETQDIRGYYLGSDGFYYAKVTATPNEITLSSGNTITGGEVYYFKVEPIRWRILSIDGEKAFILCDSIIEKMPYQSNYTVNGFFWYTTANGAPEGTYANNYKYSEVRAWLNSTFYETAFTELQREIILTTTVDNSVESTGYTSNLSACEDTEDKIFLLSYSEVTNTDYGFSTNAIEDEAREMLTSDYSRAIGAYTYFTTDKHYKQCIGNGNWFLRSPSGNNVQNAYMVFYNGCSSDWTYISSSNLGVVPAMWINLNP